MAKPKATARRKRRRSMAKLIDLTGQRFGRLTVIERVENNRRGQARWLCRCDCKKEIVVTSSNLRCGHTNSCGCFKLDSSVTHKGSKTRLYRVWVGMRERCNNPNSSRFSDYGGRGITVCAEWQHDFSAFRDWAIANGYDETAPHGTCTIDRIDNDKGYFPENCRWVTSKEQNANQRPSTHSNIAVLCVETGIVYATIHDAAKASNTGASHISACLRGQRKSAGGYTWRKA